MVAVIYFLLIFIRCEREGNRQNKMGGKRLEFPFQLSILVLLFLESSPRVLSALTVRVTMQVYRTDVS